MTPKQRAADLRRRLKHYNLSNPQAAVHLLVRRETVWRWATGDLPISDRTYDHITRVFPM